jgi:hypothetical protein
MRCVAGLLLVAPTTTSGAHSSLRSGHLTVARRLDVPEAILVNCTNCNQSEAERLAVGIAPESYFGRYVLNTSLPSGPGWSSHPMYQMSSDAFLYSKDQSWCIGPRAPQYLSDDDGPARRDLCVYSANVYAPLSNGDDAPSPDLITAGWQTFMYTENAYNTVDISLVVAAPTPQPVPTPSTPSPPTPSPTQSPTHQPTTVHPTPQTKFPSSFPTAYPTPPTSFPTAYPTAYPTYPTAFPTAYPTRRTPRPTPKKRDPDESDSADTAEVGAETAGGGASAGTVVGVVVAVTVVGGLVKKANSGGGGGHSGVKQDAAGRWQKHDGNKFGGYVQMS